MNSITTFLKLSLVLFAMMFASVNVNAQDLIVKNDGIWIEALSEEAMPAEYSVARSFYQKDDLPMQGLAKYYDPEDFFERWCHFYKR